MCVRSLLPPRPGLLGGGRDGHEEVYLAALEVGVGRDDHDLRAAALAGGSGGLLQDVLGVGLEDFRGLDGPADLLDAAVRVDDPDHVEDSARENARDAAPYGVLHLAKAPLLSLLFSFFLSLVREEEEKREGIGVKRKEGHTRKVEGGIKEMIERIPFSVYYFLERERERGI